MRVPRQVRLVQDVAKLRHGSFLRITDRANDFGTLDKRANTLMSKTDSELSVFDPSQVLLLAFF